MVIRGNTKCGHYCLMTAFRFCFSFVFSWNYACWELWAGFLWNMRLCSLAHPNVCHLVLYAFCSFIPSRVMWHNLANVLILHRTRKSHNLCLRNRHTVDIMTSGTFPHSTDFFGVGMSRGHRSQTKHIQCGTSYEDILRQKINKLSWLSTANCARFLIF